MTQKKKQKNQQNTEVMLQEELLPSTTASSVEDTTSLGRPDHLAADAGVTVPCGMCKREIWAPWTDENTVWLCGPCSDELPE